MYSIIHTKDAQGKLETFYCHSFQMNGSNLIARFDGEEYELKNRTLLNSEPIDVDASSMMFNHEYLKIISQR